MFQPDKLADLISKPAQKADPFSLRSLVEWLERQNPREVYDHNSASVCLACQYATDMMGERVTYNKASYRLEEGIGQERKLKILYDQTDGNFSPYASAYTFGAALQRARNLLSEGME